MPRPAPISKSPDTAANRTQKAILIGSALASSSAAAASVYYFAPQSMFVRPPDSVDSAVGAPQALEIHDKSAADDRAGAADALILPRPNGLESNTKKTGYTHDEFAGKFIVAGTRGVFIPEPIVVSIRPTGRVRYLKLGYAVETAPDAGAAFVERELRLRDALNIYLRAVDIASLEDPASMTRIRMQIERRISAVVAPAPVTAVLITDFILS